MQEDYVISFFKDHCTIYLRNNKVGNSFLINGLFKLYVDVSIHCVEQNVNAISFKCSRDNMNEKYL